MAELTPYRLPSELEEPLVVELFLQDEAVLYEYFVIGAESTAAAIAAVAARSPRSQETRQPMGRSTCAAVLVEYEGRIYVDNVNRREGPLVSEFECEHIREWASPEAARFGAMVAEHGANAISRPQRPGAAL